MQWSDEVPEGGFCVNRWRLCSDLRLGNLCTFFFQTIEKNHFFSEKPLKVAIVNCIFIQVNQNNGGFYESRQTTYRKCATEYNCGM